MKTLSGCRGVDTANDIEQGRLAAARGSRDGQEHAFLDRKCNIVKRNNLLLAQSVFLGHAFDADQAHRCTPVWGCVIRGIFDMPIDSSFSRARCLLACFVLSLSAGTSGATDTPAAEDPLARSILEKADEIRFPAESFQVDIYITSSAPDQDTEKRKYRVLSKGNENTVVMILEPASERGQIMLMKGRDLWVFMPDVSQPIRLGLAQRLTGQVANGDLARANFTGDYNPKDIAHRKGGRRGTLRSRTD